MSAAIRKITPALMHHRLATEQETLLVDVRSSAEFLDAHAKGALSIPLDNIDATDLAQQLGGETGTAKPLYLICASGLRSDQAALRLQAQGLNKLFVVEGGTDAWSESQLPVKHVDKGMSLVRQTQIAVGVLILLLLTKAALLHPVFYALVGLLGAGLIFAGISSRCALSSLIARMPWNTPSIGSTAS